MQKIHSIIKKKNTWSDNRNVLVCVWCSSLFEWASLQITLLWEKLILTADNQTETRRLGINQQQSPSIHFDCPPPPLSLDSKGDSFMMKQAFLITEGFGLIACVCRVRACVLGAQGPCSVSAGHTAGAVITTSATQKQT